MVAAAVKNQRSFVYNNGATILRHKIQNGGNLNARTSDSHIHIFGKLKLSLNFLENNCIIDFLSSDLTSIFYNSGGSL